MGSYGNIGGHFMTPDGLIFRPDFWGFLQSFAVCFNRIQGSRKLAQLASPPNNTGAPFQEAPLFPMNQIGQLLKPGRGPFRGL
jgi:hypothetical protein